MLPAIKASDVRKAILEKIDEWEAGLEFDHFINREIWRWEEGDEYWCNARWTSTPGMAIQTLNKVNNKYGAEIITRPSGHTRVTLRLKPENQGPRFFTPLIEVVGTAETLALAICRAAAKKIMLEKWGKQGHQNGNQTINP